MKVVSSAEIGGANGAFAEATDTIYLSRELLAGGNLGAIADVLREEVGHSVDARLNVTDSPGDEGAIFARVVQGKELSEGDLQGLKDKNDSATVLFNGQTISIEKADDYYAQNWGGEIFDWSSGITSKGFYKFTLNDGNAISSRNAISRNWGDGAPLSNLGLTGSDKFGVNFYTKADFEAGKTYEFSIKADDSYRIGAFPVNGNQWVNISGQNWNWLNDAYGGKKYTFTPGTTGKYWVYGGYKEQEGAASFALSWDKVSNPISGSGTATKGSESKPIEFKSVGRPLSEIANRPTWVLTHGFNDSSDDDKIQSLAKAIYDRYQDRVQVLILDWRKAANAGINLSEAASWIEPVADATKKKLFDEWKIDPSNINLVGHSLGSYVAWQTAKDLGGVNKLIALDPAATTNGGYQEGNVNFSDYSKWAWAFYGSALGNFDRAYTADESFYLKFNSVVQLLETDKHIAVVTAFAKMIENNNEINPDQISKLFNLDQMGSSAGKPWRPGPEFEAKIDFDSRLVPLGGKYSSLEYA
ncbi:MAG: alpha/beta fold hydrolase [Microcoleus sp.]